jgi:anaerobic magnesium-protoporphyrin IX monomethyl ester cyclase
MARVMLVQPWNYHDEDLAGQVVAEQWRNGPYSLVLLATQLRRHGHDVAIVDMIRDLIVADGSVEAILAKLQSDVTAFRPDILGFGFFSIHYLETIRAVEAARAACRRAGLPTVFVAGGIHASTEPELTLKNMGFDLAFLGEADISLLRFAETGDARSIPGIVSADSLSSDFGPKQEVLDELPFPDWSLVDYRFYAQPSRGKIKTRYTSSLDLIMGRGCVYKCTFCAYPTLSSVRFHSAEYLVEQVDYMHRAFGVDSVYFTDSTIGNNRKLIVRFAELMLARGLSERVEWHANIRPNQVNEELLRLMWRAGCRFLFYGFESGSQRVLDLMAKGCKTADNVRAAALHEKLGFPYHASMLLGFPGETEDDVQATLAFMRQCASPSMGVNWYVPLPGSPDYDRLKGAGVLDVDDPRLWRRIGEVNGSRVYADVEERRFRELFADAERIAYQDLPTRQRGLWGCLAPPHAAMTLADA